jgi:rfaE bifunctional protein kinase chain/domain
MSKVTFVAGNFNILHPGHLRILRFAKDLGEKLIVGVYGDQLGGEAVHIPEDMRLENVQSNVWVDEAFLITDSLEESIESVKPDYVVKGKEYEGLINPELEVLEKYGGKLIFSSGESVFSSADLINRDLEVGKRFALDFSDGYFKRHSFTKESLREVISEYRNQSVCVIGDLIVDEYITCDPLGMSQEDPTIVVSPVDSTKFVGGSAIVAAHACSLGANVSYISVSGQDTTREFVQEEMEKMGIDSMIFIDDSRPTTLKQRYRSKDKTLLRVSHLHQGAISNELQDKIFEEIQIKIDQSNILIFSDFNYGCLPQNLVDKITNYAKGKEVIMAADSQSSSQMGDISRFKGMDFIFPTEHEARIALRNYDDGLVVLSEKLSQISDSENVILKLGSDGVLLHFKDNKFDHYKTDRLKALNSSPKDVAGAGDSMLISTLLSYAAGADQWKAALIGSVSAAIQIGRVGNLPISEKELLDFLFS